MTSYILKVKGIARIPDYLQIRDDNFALEYYLRIDRLSDSLDKTAFKHKKKKLLEIVNSIPFGEVKKISL